MTLRIVLLLLFSAVSASAAQKWTALRSPNFQFVGDASAGQIKEVAEEFEVFRWGFSQFFRLREGDSSAGTTVFVFESDYDFKPYKPLYKGKPANVAGYFLGDDEKNLIALAVDGEVPRVVYHEYVHRLMNDNLPNVPPWFSEGFAECFGSLEVEGRKLRIGRAIGEHVSLLNQRTFMPLEKLFAVTHDSPEYNEDEKQGLFYAESWALVHYLMLGENMKYQQPLFRFLNALNSGQPAARLFEQIFETDLASFQKTFEAYIQQRVAWPAAEIRPPNGFDPARNLKPRTMPEAEVEYHLGDLLLRMDRLAEAEAHLKKSIQADAKLGEAHAAMARLQSEQDKEADALASIEKAVALSPENYLVRYYRALLTRRSKRPLTDVDSEIVRSDLKKSLSLAPQFTAAVEMLANVNLQRNTDIVPTIDMLVQARQTSPGNDNLKLLLAYAVSRTGDRELARPAALEIARSGSASPGMKQSALQLIDYLDRARASFNSTPARGTAAGGDPPLPVRQETRTGPRMPVVSESVTVAPEPDAPVRPRLEREPVAEVEPASGAAEDSDRPYAIGPAGREIAGTSVFLGRLTLLDCRDGLTITVVGERGPVYFHSRAPEKVRFTRLTTQVGTSIECGPVAAASGLPVSITYIAAPKEGTPGELLAIDFIESGR